MDSRLRRTGTTTKPRTLMAHATNGPWRRLSNKTMIPDGQDYGKQTSWYDTDEPDESDGTTAQLQRHTTRAPDMTIHSGTNGGRQRTTCKDYGHGGTHTGEGDKTTTAVGTGELHTYWTEHSGRTDESPGEERPTGKRGQTRGRRVRRSQAK